MYDEAIDQYSEIIRLNPKHVKSLYNMGRIYFQLGNYSGRFKAISKCFGAGSE